METEPLSTKESKKLYKKFRRPLVVDEVLRKDRYYLRELIGKATEAIRVYESRKQNKANSITKYTVQQ